jgi:alkanesulfonate monooxygenase SsuD/methylene tetrahydromethanopterin reductase-like flavin-dependent oxidoreductase (luciferase family)
MPRIRGCCFATRNEHVVGAGWPGRVERHERLVEAIDIIQGVLAGTMTNYRGQHFRLDHARLFDRPERKPDMIIAAGGVKAARLAGKLGNGLIATEARADLVEAYAAAGGPDCVNRPDTSIGLPNC